MELLRESACDCLSEIINKGTVIYRSAVFPRNMKKSWLELVHLNLKYHFSSGMLPLDKTKLVQSLLKVLEDACVLPPSKVCLL